MMVFPMQNIEDICDIGDGAHASIKRVAEGVLYLTAKNFKDTGLVLNSVDYISQKDYEKHFCKNTNTVLKPKTSDLVFSIIGTIGVPYVVKKNDKFGLSSSVAILRPKKQILLSSYLYYWMLSSAFQNHVLNIKSGVAQGFLSLGMIKKLPVSLPSLLIQKKIAAILSAYDDLIENNNRRIAILEKMAEEIYREWFVRMRFPGYEKVKFVNGIPEGWKVKELKDVASVVDCLHTKKPDYTEDGEGWLLQLENIKENGRIDKSYRFKISKSDYDLWAKNIEVCEGDCVITNVGRIAAVAKIPRGMKAALGRNMTAVRPIKIPATFLIQFLLSPHMKEEVLKKQDLGAIMGSMNVRSIYKISVTIPDKKLLLRFDSIINPIRRNIENYLDVIINLKETRDLLLSRLISGKLPVDNLNISFPPSMEETNA